jgi:hypothetical protein
MRQMRWAMVCAAFCCTVVATWVKAQPAPGRPGANQAELIAFYESGAYKSWTADKAIRRTGPYADGVDYSTHGNVRIFYSPDVIEWLKQGRPKGGIPDGAVIYKIHYPTAPDAPNKDVPTGFAAMVRQKNLSYDGWFWSVYSPQGINRGQAFIPWCLGCHASAEREQTFITLNNIEGTPMTYAGAPGPDMPRLTKAHDSVGPLDTVKKAASLDALPDPLGAPDPDFLRQFPQWTAPSRADVRAFPSNSFDHVAPRPDGSGFVTSSICGGCHDADLLLDNAEPAMVATDRAGNKLNLSPFGEWGASMMGLAGRDPVFHAQLESEKAIRPQLAGFLDQTCYRCHGVMGQREAHAAGRSFEHAMVYATGAGDDARFGALARDGVSCAACHRATAEGLGTSATYTGLFNVAPGTTIFGPFTEPAVYPMQQAIGATPQYGAQIKTSALCGSCHTVILPVLAPGGAYTGADPFADAAVIKGHEQTTYLEWRNSAYQNERAPAATARTCQQCHMPQTFGSAAPLAFRIANIEDSRYPAVDNRAADPLITIRERTPFSRHTLVGINLFVMSMFQQFAGILGLQGSDINVPGDTASSLRFAEQESVQLGREQTARVEITSVSRTAGFLEARVRVTNLAGHKLPSGVGFRRAFLELEAVDGAGAPVWASGRPSNVGVILDGAGQPLATELSETAWQPHHDVISSESDAQIYESRHLDTTGKLTTSFIGLSKEVKDNRLLPKGWSTTAPETDFMQPIGVHQDSRYADGSGSDEIVYRIPLARAAGVVAVSARLHYQSIPPYYLRDRFTLGRGDETKRLYYLASHLSVADTPVDGWVFTIAEARAAVPAR